MLVDVLNGEILLREGEGDLYCPSPPEPENCQTSVRIQLFTLNILKHQTCPASLLCAQAGCFGELIEF